MCSRDITHAQIAAQGAERRTGSQLVILSTYISTNRGLLVPLCAQSRGGNLPAGDAVRLAERLQGHKAEKEERFAFQILMIHIVPFILIYLT